jgi:hypothetical protein
MFLRIKRDKEDDKEDVPRKVLFCDVLLCWIIFGAKDQKDQKGREQGARGNKRGSKRSVL